VPLADVSHAWMLTGDIGEVALPARHAQSPQGGPHDGEG
jgi:hypothetical protein